MDVESLKAQRDQVRETLRGLENEQRQMDAQQKALRQREIRAKRTLEALETLIGLASETDPETTAI
jgi:predicted  nucleic acid-binding Zn-ribbon protein